MDPRELDQKDEPEPRSWTSPSNKHLQPAPSLPILGTASCKTTSTTFYLLSPHPDGPGFAHRRRRTSGFAGCSPDLTHVHPYIQSTLRQTPTSRNTLQMAKPRDLRRILLSLTGLSAPPELRPLLPRQSSCHIITGLPKLGTERWIVSTGKYLGRAVLPTGSCISPVSAKSCNRGVTLHLKGHEELTITVWSSSDSECGVVA